MRKKIGEILIENNIIEQFHIKSALEYQKRHPGKPLGECLVDMGYISDVKLAVTLAKIFEIPTIDLDKTIINPETVSALPRKLAEKHNVVPVLLETEGKRKKLFIATADPSDTEAIDEIRFATGCTVFPMVATYAAIDRAFRRCYEGEASGMPKDAVEPLTLKISVEDIEKGMEVIQDGQIRVVHLYEETNEKTERGVAVLPPEQDEDQDWDAETRLRKPTPPPEIEKHNSDITESTVVHPKELLSDLNDEKINNIFENKVTEEAMQAIKSTKINLDQEPEDEDKTQKISIRPQVKNKSTSKHKTPLPLTSLLTLLEKKNIISTEEKKLIETSASADRIENSKYIDSLIEVLEKRGIITEEEKEKIKKE